MLELISVTSIASVFDESFKTDNNETSFAAQIIAADTPKRDINTVMVDVSPGTEGWLHGCPV